MYGKLELYWTGTKDNFVQIHNMNFLSIPLNDVSDEIHMRTVRLAT
jgi:hypothetical protein